MGTIRLLVVFSALTLGLAPQARAAAPGAAPPVRMEICTGDQGSLTAQQDWARSLAKLGIDGVQFRPVQPEDGPKIENRGTADRPSYAVTALLMPNGELVVPGGRFRPNEAGRLSSWLADLARTGPTLGQKKSAFGLAVSQLEQAHNDLATPLGVPTKDRSRRELIERIQGRLTIPLRVAPGLLERIPDEKITAEFGELSCGTSLALILRGAGLGLIPAAANGGKLEYQIVATPRGTEAWPVGWPAPTPLQEVLPTLFEFHNINVQGVSLRVVLTAVQERVQAPMLLDEVALAHNDIDPDKITANHPQGRTAYNLLLRKVLAAAKLKYEVRIDEAGKPFLWITSLKSL